MSLEFSLPSESCNNLSPLSRRKSLSIDEIATQHSTPVSGSYILSLLPP